MTAIGVAEMFAAGLLSVLTPCVLPMLPFYLCLVTGRALTHGPARRQIDPTVPLAFAAGLIAVFVLSCMGGSSAGRVFIAWLPVLRLIAAGLILMAAMGVLGSRDMSGPASLPWAAALGASFGFGWIPCIGPSLAGLIGIASRAPASGLALLLVYGAGMALPFVVIGWGLPAVIPKLPRLRALRIAAGFGLLIFALLIATDNMNRIGQWMLERGDWSATLR
ncbi:cytochrome c biogenesis CcdA family protein [Paracoccus sediminicola]|uniref:cytochrome c biogenesis CcdA family protein n=1 Tax=Paracoccus sediminicola TaxID=3017783 RepID=UPI0022F0E65E|nr:cytochrome c biogenesis CcdA family protein [Paracoccus sediminicola]WBU57688.1 cytochrome c biogenesis CcdA family protein [Paracoccus sediminicola]